MNDNNNEVNDEFVSENLKELCHLIMKSGDEHFLMDFCECLFTKAERTDFAKRWQLVKEINSGVTQRDIAKKYGMSLCKITRGSKELAKPESAFRKMLDLRGDK